MVEQGERAHCSPRNGLSTLPHLAGAELQDPRIYGHRAGGRLHRFSSYLLHLSLPVPAPKRKEHLGNVSGAGALGQKQVQPPLTQDGLLSGYLSFWLSTFSRLIHPVTARWLSCSFEKKNHYFLKQEWRGPYLGTEGPWGTEETCVCGTLRVEGPGCHLHSLFPASPCFSPELLSLW